jgi:hypothetical protein
VRHLIISLKGESTIFYIGKAKWRLYDRYIRKIDAEVNEYWDRYSHIIARYGNITIDIYSDIYLINIVVYGSNLNKSF